MKRYLTLTILLLLCVVFAGTAHARKTRHVHKIRIKAPVFHLNGATDTISSYNLLYFAQSLIGTPYRAASSDPSRGFDCSGFVSYVFKSFDADVPRSSGDFASAGHEININDVRQGDILLFKGTKSHHPHSIGHVAIVYSNACGQLTFIHSTSGKENGVTITTMDDTYKRRFVKAVRLLRENDIFQAQAN